jgi:hypothetical protein
VARSLASRPDARDPIDSLRHSARLASSLSVVQTNVGEASMATKRIAQNIASLVLGVLGVSLMAAASWQIMNLRDFTAHANYAEGKVVSVRGGAANGHDQRLPLFQYTVRGKSYEARAQFSFFGLEYGQPVAVVYDPADPHHALIDSFGQLWCTPTILLVLGVLLLGRVVDGLVHERRATIERPT